MYFYRSAVNKVVQIVIDLWDAWKLKRKTFPRTTGCIWERGGECKERKEGGTRWREMPRDEEKKRKGRECEKGQDKPEGFFQLFSSFCRSRLRTSYENVWKSACISAIAFFRRRRTLGAVVAAFITISGNEYWWGERLSVGVIVVRAHALLWNAEKER